MTTFRDHELGQQSIYFERFPDAGGVGGKAYRLQPEHQHLNLANSIQEPARRYFKKYGIHWHTHSNHGLSSQVCCLNFLMPLAERPDILAQLVAAALGGNVPEMLPVEDGPDQRPWFVGFEWIGGDYLNESDKKGNRSRGANATSADAVVKFRRGGVTETLLIEWKYTERYGAPINVKGNAVRLGRYANLAFHPNGPVRGDLGLKLEDFFYEPFYQMLRQQMLAFQMQKSREDGADRVRVLHISPAGNKALRKVTAPTLQRIGSNAFEVWKSLLVKPEDFMNRSAEGLFNPLIEAADADGGNWASYLRARYQFLVGQGPDRERNPRKAYPKRK